MMNRELHPLPSVEGELRALRKALGSLEEAYARQHESVPGMVRLKCPVCWRLVEHTTLIWNAVIGSYETRFQCKTEGCAATVTVAVTTSVVGVKAEDA